MLIYVSVYTDLICTVDPITGSGDVIIHHNYDGLSTQRQLTPGLDNTTIDILLTYLAPSTNDELQDIITKSSICQQNITVQDIQCLDYISWTALNGYIWHPSMVLSR